MAGKPFDETQSSAGVKRAPQAEDAATEDMTGREPRHVSGVELEAGTLIAGRFRLEECLGEGGMGVVWRATHAMTRKAIALKFLKRAGHDDHQAVKRFIREARAACAVHHPGIVEIHDVLELEDGSPVMVMELLEGETLAHRLERQVDRKLPVAEFARIMVHVCSAVACAHTLGIVHRDLKPENIFLADAHGALVVKVLDFGIAKLTARDGDAAQTDDSAMTSGALGTPYYMAPEQLLGDKTIDHRADIWALGIIFYEVLAGVIPTERPNVGQIIKAIMTGGLGPLRRVAPGLPEPVLALVDRMLTGDSSKRPADLGEVLAVISSFTDEPYIPAGAPQARYSLPEGSASRVVIRPAGAVPADLPSRPRVGADRVDADTANAATFDALPPASPVAPVAQPTRPSPRRWPLLLAGIGLAGLAAYAWLWLARGAPRGDVAVSASPPASGSASPVTANPAPPGR